MQGKGMRCEVRLQQWRMHTYIVPAAERWPTLPPLVVETRACSDTNLYNACLVVCVLRQSAEGECRHLLEG